MRREISAIAHRGDPRSTGLHRQIAPLLALNVLLGACTALGVDATDTRRDEIAAATAAWQVAFNSREPRKIAALYADDAVFWGTTATVVATTPAAILDYFKDAPNRPNSRVTFLEQHVRVYGDLGSSTGSYTFSDVRNGVESATAARYSFLFHKRGNSWYIVQHHSSRLPMP